MAFPLRQNCAKMPSARHIMALLMAKKHDASTIATFCSQQGRGNRFEKPNRRWACWNCPKLEKIGNYGYCPDLNLEMSLEVAKRERLCRE